MVMPFTVILILTFCMRVVTAGTVMVTVALFEMDLTADFLKMEVAVHIVLQP
jgi:hypothetical protein